MGTCYSGATGRCTAEMRIIARNTLVAYWTKHPETKSSLQRWFATANAADWASAEDVRAAFPKASVITGERIRFEVHGGNYRLVVAFKFEAAIAFIKFIGTHAEYDRIDAATIEFSRR